MQLSPGSIFHLPPTIIPTAFRGIVTPHATMFRGGGFSAPVLPEAKEGKKGFSNGLIVRRRSQNPPGLPQVNLIQMHVKSHSGMSPVPN